MKNIAPRFYWATLSTCASGPTWTFFLRARHSKDIHLDSLCRQGDLGLWFHVHIRKPNEYSTCTLFEMNLEVSDSSSVQIQDLGDSICSYAKSIPSGIVCFFVSYAYMDHVVSVWKKLGVMDKLSKIKKVFMEPRTASASNAILKQYETDIQAPNSKVRYL